MLLAATASRPGEPHLSMALFDLDNTLLGGDSDYLWGEFLISIGALDKEAHQR